MYRPSFTQEREWEELNRNEQPNVPLVRVGRRGGEGGGGGGMIGKLTREGEAKTEQVCSNNNASEAEAYEKGGQ